MDKEITAHEVYSVRLCLRAASGLERVQVKMEGGCRPTVFSPSLPLSLSLSLEGRRRDVIRTPVPSVVRFLLVLAPMPPRCCSPIVLLKNNVERASRAAQGAGNAILKTSAIQLGRET